MNSRTTLLLLFAASNSTAYHCKIARYRRARKRFNLIGQVQIHHVIPRQMQHNPLLSEFDMDNFKNIVFVPVHPSVIRIKLYETRIDNHEGGHPAYNYYVRSLLNNAQPDDLDKICFHLKQGLRRRTIPWH